MTERILRGLIRQLLESDDDCDEEREKNLLTEPDIVKDPDDAPRDDEASTASSIAGVSTPLGAGPHYPGPDLSPDKKIKKQIDVVGRAFGAAKPIKR